MKSLALLLLLLLYPPPSARADDASRKAKAKEIVELLHLNRAADNLIEAILRQVTTITTQRAGGSLTPEVQASLDEFKKKVMATIGPQVSWDAIEPEYIQRYTDTFSEQELDGLLAFYKSPIGAAVLEKVPALNQQVTQVVQTRVATLQPQMNKMLNDFEQTVPPKAAPPSSSGPGQLIPTPPAPSQAPNPAPSPGTSTPQ